MTHSPTYTFFWAVHTDNPWYSAVYTPLMLRALQNGMRPRQRCVIHTGDWLGWRNTVSLTRHAFAVTYQPHGLFVPTLDYLHGDRYDSRRYLFAVDGLSPATAQAVHTALWETPDYRGMRPVAPEDPLSAQWLCRDGLCADTFRLDGSALSVPCIIDQHNYSIGRNFPLGPDCRPDRGWFDVLSSDFPRIRAHHSRPGAARRWLTLFPGSQP